VNAAYPSPAALPATAGVAAIGTVPKVSNLMLSGDSCVRVAAAVRLTNAYRVEARGNTDEPWPRSLRYLVENRLLAEGEGPK
jgi:hypothetical protein